MLMHIKKLRETLDESSLLILSFETLILLDKSFNYIFLPPIIGIFGL